MDELEQDTSGFTPVYITAQAFGLLSVVLCGVWTGSYRGGFAWSSSPGHQFNWHPFLMTLGLIFLYGNGILVYRVFRQERKRKLKLAHAGVNLTAFVLAVVGLMAVFGFHNASGIPNMYSLHSWLGILTVALFAFQWLCGLTAFLFPGLATHVRALYLPYHVFLGTLAFVLACATALIGLTEKAIFIGNDIYKNKEPEGTLINCLGLAITLFAILVIYLVGNTRYKRLTRPEDELLLQESAGASAAND